MKLINSFLIFCSILLFSSCIDEQIVVDNTPRPQGRIIISSEPDSAHIYFLGTDTKKVTPDSIMDLESGIFDVTLKMDGYRDTTLNVRVLNNHKSSRHIILSQLEVGTIYVASDPEGAQIYLGDKNTNKVTPDTLVNIDPGVYSLALKLAGFRDTSVTVSVEKWETAEMNVLLKDTLPEIAVTIEYSDIQFGQLLFSFEFNRNISLSQILSRRPDSDSITTTNFNENVPKGQTRVLIFSEKEAGTWRFTVRGQKTQGDMRPFEIHGNIDVQ